MKRFGKKNNRRSGFTLLELLLVMAILVVLAGLSTFAVLSMQSSAYRKAAFTEINTISTACEAYKLDVGSFPANLKDLTVLPSGVNQSVWQGPYLKQTVSNDPWNHPYKYTPDNQNNLAIITSAGPDGQTGTQDDVTNARNQ